MQRLAHIEAERHLRRGLELLARLPQTASRLQREIALQNALGVCLMPTRGFGNPEVAAAFARGAELAERSDDARGLFVSLRGRGQYHFISGDLKASRNDTQRVMALAERLGDHDCLLEAHHLAWGTLCFTGELAAAQRHVEAGIARYQRERDHHLTYTYSGHDPGVCGRGFGALILVQLGYAKRAQTLADDALALAEALAHPFTMTIALQEVAGLHLLLREPDALRAIGERIIGYSSDMGLRPMVPVGRDFRGEALTHQGEIAEGIAELRESLAEHRAMGTLNAMPIQLGALADALARSGKTDEGLAAVEEALKMADAGGDRFGLPEIHRVRGSLLLDRFAADRDPAAAAYRQAIEIARAQQARLLELWAATSLARLWGESGRRDAARKMLAPVYRWFTEGFDKPDLRDASSLLKNDFGAAPTQHKFVAAGLRAQMIRWKANSNSFVSCASPYSEFFRRLLERFSTSWHNHVCSWREPSAVGVMSAAGTSATCGDWSRKPCRCQSGSSGLPSVRIYEARPSSPAALARHPRRQWRRPRPRQAGPCLRCRRRGWLNRRSVR